MKKINFLIVIFAIILFSSCGGGSEVDKEALKEELRKELEGELSQKETDDEIVETVEKRTKSTETKTAEFRMGTFNNSMAQNLSYEGDIVRGEAFDDANGKNIVLFTRKEKETHYSEGPGDRSIYLYAYHFADKGDGFKKLTDIKDWEKDCGLVNHAEFRFSTLKITDLDNDGFAEITFMYRLGCNSDPTPIPIKLMMLENGKKYAIRGTTRVEMGTEHFGDEMNVDPSFNNAPKEFLDFAKKVWETDKSYF